MEGGKTDIEQSIKEVSSHLKKVTEAVYKITDLFSDKEPLKWELRNEGLAVLRLFVSFENAEPHKRLNYFDKIIFKITRALDLIDLASSSSFIAGVNFNVLKKEYEKIKSFMENSKFLEVSSSDLLGIGLTPPTDIFQNELLDSAPIFENSESLMNNDPLKTAQKRDFIMDRNNKGHSANISMSVMSDINRARGIKPASNNNVRIKIKDTAPQKELTERGKRIIKIINIKDNKKIGINEVFGNFKQISKKTIQRELKKLTQDGYLECKGEKRWRVYEVVRS